MCLSLHVIEEQYRYIISAWIHHFRACVRLCLVLLQHAQSYAELEAQLQHRTELRLSAGHQ